MIIFFFCFVISSLPCIRVRTSHKISSNNVLILSIKNEDFLPRILLCLLWGKLPIFSRLCNPSNIWLPGENNIYRFHICGCDWFWNCLHRDTYPFQNEVGNDDSLVSAMFAGLKINKLGWMLIVFLSCSRGVVQFFVFFFVGTGFLTAWVVIWVKSH